MAVSSKGKRKVNVLGRPYIWYVQDGGRAAVPDEGFVAEGEPARFLHIISSNKRFIVCLLYTSDAADDLLCVDLGGRRINKKKKQNNKKKTTQPLRSQLDYHNYLLD